MFGADIGGSSRKDVFAPEHRKLTAKRACVLRYGKGFLLGSAPEFMRTAKGSLVEQDHDGPIARATTALMPALCDIRPWNVRPGGCAEGRVSRCRLHLTQRKDFPSPLRCCVARVTARSRLSQHTSWMAFSGRVAERSDDAHLCMTGASDEGSEEERPANVYLEIP